MLDTPRAPRNDYPAGDGKPIAETDWHRDAMFRLLRDLEQWFRHDERTYVSGGLLVFFEEGNRRARVTPDVFVVRGVPNFLRDNYLLWEEGRGLDVVIELTSRKTRRTDFGRKLDLYTNRLGVKEFFLFDPREEYLTPSFQGYRKTKAGFRPIEFVNGRLPSEHLGLHLERSGEHLRLWNPVTGERLPTPGERAAQADALASENERLRAELAILRGKK